MPKATQTHTLNPSILLRLDPSGWPEVPGDKRPLSYQDAILREACRAALMTHTSVTALSDSLAELPPDDPRCCAVRAAIGRLRVAWFDEVEQAWTVPASGPEGLRDKAELLDLLIARDGNGTLPRSPVLNLAASLAADVLRQHGAAAL
jgi:hypothetical protein